MGASSLGNGLSDVLIRNLKKNGRGSSVTLRVQTSVAGRAIPRGWGQNACAPNVIWYGNLIPIPHESGGKGLGGGKGGGTTTYTYTAALELAFCLGPVEAFIRIWNNVTPQSLASLDLVPILGTTTQNPWDFLTNQPIQEWHSVPEVSLYTVQVNYHSPFLEDDGVIDSQGNNYKFVTGAPAVNQYQVNTSTGTYTFNAANAGAYVGISYSAGNQPTQALAYREIALLVGSAVPLGGAPEVPNIRAEILFGENGAIPTQPDADGSVVVSDIVMDCGFNPSWIGDFSSFSNYVRATGMITSPILVDQQAASSFLNTFTAALNTTLVWNGSVLNAVPYGDSDITANGATYLAPTAPIYLFNETDFSRKSQGGVGDVPEPVTISRSRPLDEFNVVKVEFLDRGNSYDPAVIEAKNDASITQFGLRPMDQLTYSFFALPSAATMSAHLTLGRQAIRNTYSFDVGPEYILLDPADIVALSVSALGITDQWVRITQIDENSDGSLSFTVEEYLNGTGAAPLYSVQDHNGYTQNLNQPPPPTNKPILVALPYQKEQLLQLGIPLSGPIGWGGCDLYVSTDNTTYTFIGRQNGPCRQGVLASPLPIGSDPDLVNTLTVDLSMSDGVLVSATQQDADNNLTLCYVDGEFISFANVTLVSDNIFQLSYLRRGQFNTPIRHHSTSTDFARLDNTVMSVKYDKSQIGTTLYAKALAFNIWQGGEETLDEVDPIVTILPGIPIPPDVEGFTAAQVGDVVAFAWQAVDDPALKGYDIGYLTFGTPAIWESFTILTEAGAGTEMTNASVPAGNWTFGIRARDIADQVSADITTFDLVVVNNTDLLLTYEADPIWPVASGPSPAVGFVKHWTGVLVPDSTLLANNAGSGWNTFDDFVISPIATSVYVTPTSDIGFDDDTGITFVITSVPGPGESTGLVPVFEIDPWLTGGSDPNSYMPYTSGQVNLRYLRTAVSFTNVFGQVSYLQVFNFAIDALPLKEQANNVTVAPGGTVITFPQPYHSAPFVFATAVSGTGLYATASSVSSTQFTLNVYDHTGTSVGGSANWQSQGV